MTLVKRFTSFSFQRMTDQWRTIKYDWKLQADLSFSVRHWSTLTFSSIPVLKHYAEGGEHVRWSSPPETSDGCPDELMWEEFEYCGQEWKVELSILWISQREVRECEFRVHSWNALPIKQFFSKFMSFSSKWFYACPVTSWLRGSTSIVMKYFEETEWANRHQYMTVQLDG